MSLFNSVDIRKQETETKAKKKKNSTSNKEKTALLRHLKATNLFEIYEGDGTWQDSKVYP